MRTRRSLNGLRWAFAILWLPLTLALIAANFYLAESLWSGVVGKVAELEPGRGKTSSGAAALPLFVIPILFSVGWFALYNHLAGRFPPEARAWVEAEARPRPLARFIAWAVPPGIVAVGLALVILLPSGCELENVPLLSIGVGALLFIAHLGLGGWLLGGRANASWLKLLGLSLICWLVLALVPWWGTLNRALDSGRGQSLHVRVSAVWQDSVAVDSWRGRPWEEVCAAGPATATAEVGRSVAWVWIRPGAFGTPWATVVDVLPADTPVHADPRERAGR